MGGVIDDLARPRDIIGLKTGGGVRHTSAIGQLVTISRSGLRASARDLVPAFPVRLHHDVARVRLGCFIGFEYQNNPRVLGAHIRNRTLPSETIRAPN